MPKFYTGVGSRKAPQDILMLIKQTAAFLSHEGWILRSGGADGCDTAFERGATKSQIFYAKDANKEALAIAAKYHPSWDRLSPFVKNLHGRNVFQVLGRDLKTPSRFLICWTPDGCKSHKERTTKTGGTGTAISIASENNIPVFNLKNVEDLNKVIKQIDKYLDSFALPEALDNKLRIVKQDMWNFIGKVDAICITTNGFVKKDGKAVMGRGCAQEAKRRYPNIDFILAKHIQQKGNVPGVLAEDKGTKIISFPVKPEQAVFDKLEEACKNTVKHMRDKVSKMVQDNKFVVPGWACRADTGIIQLSCNNMIKEANKNNFSTIVLPCPGIGAGELNYEEEVKPILEAELDERFIIAFKS